MKSPIIIPSSPDINSNTMMKPPHVSSIPSLMDINPNSPFEFHFPADEPWWDEYDTSDYTSDYNSDFSCDSLFSSESEFDLDEDLDISFNSMFYHISHMPAPDSEAIPIEDEICRRSPREEEILIPKLISLISSVAPKNVYKRRRNSMKRKRQRQRRKKMAAASIEPELRTLWTNFVGVLPVMGPVLPPPPTSNLPTVNLGTVNKQMLRRLPDVVYLPVQSCSPDPAFYERNIPCRVLDNHFVSGFTRDSPFGKLAAIHTNLGPISPPTDACYGYVWTEEGWRVKAEDPRVPDPGGGHGRGRGEEDRGGRVRGREAKGGERKCVRDIK